MRPLSHIFYKWIPISSLLKKLLFKFYVNGFPYIFFAQELFFSSFLKISTHVFFSQDLCEIQVVNPTHEQIKSIKSSIKSTPVWSFIKNSSLQTNPLLTNQIDSNQLSLKLWLKINCTLEASWKYLSNHAWWCCVKL